MTRTSDELTGSERAWFEYRVWGRHPRACKRLARLASSTTDEIVEDWYLLSEAPRVNAKVRGDAVKLKRLVDERQGFEAWVSERHRRPERAPEPFDEVLASLPDRRRPDPEAVTGALDALAPSLGFRTVRVRKHRHLHRVGPLRAEVTDIEVVATGETLRTIVIEGRDLDALVALRERLGLRGEPNVALHQAIAPDD